VMFQKSDLAASGSPTPRVILSNNGGSLDSPFGLVFQGKGTLWVSNIDMGTISKFLLSQIKTSGAPVPKVFLMTSTEPYQITFGPVLGKVAKMH
jgi:hypothetical protein